MDVGVEQVPRAGRPVASAGVSAPGDAPFLVACRGERPAWTPVWFMRQAGRALPEYRTLRGEGSILDAIKRPDLAAELTLQPVRRYGVDAAILYSDIVVPAHAIGFGVDVNPGTGPVVAEPFRRPADLIRLRPLEPDEDTPYVLEAVRLLAKDLNVPLIGFAGAPFTVASYLVEGGPSRSYARTKALMYGDEPLWHLLLERLADLAVASLRSQIGEGAQAFQLFDSWAGALAPADYRRYVLPHSSRVFAGVADLGVPGIHFGVQTGELLGLFAATGAQVVGVDWRTPLDVARARIEASRKKAAVVQGNLDPAACLNRWPIVEQKVREVLDANGGHPGHVFNLGHGVLPETDPAVLTQVVSFVHEATRR
jgi:uroporphyrinogen decarboxylase